MYPLHPGCHITSSRVPCDVQWVLVGFPFWIQQCVHDLLELHNYPLPQHLTLFKWFTETIYLSLGIIHNKTFYWCNRCVSDKAAGDEQERDEGQHSLSWIYSEPDSGLCRVGGCCLESLRWKMDVYRSPRSWHIFEPVTSLITRKTVFIHSKDIIEHLEPC